MPPSRWSVQSTQTRRGAETPVKDFLISYTTADQAWAEWIAWHLEEAGYSTVLQAWDFLPGSNFVVEMDEATIWTERTILVLSERYLVSEFAKAEWATRFREDPVGQGRRIIPVRIEACEVKGQSCLRPCPGHRRGHLRPRPPHPGEGH